ncbi:Cro/Cl family transcriptional regulator [Streptococcus phage Str-PAP-1]|uniref:helix-turn-helix transcriptional regulator n=1 Tax=Streptococcus phage Str-PAP-1 TaxID=1589270 RepID=UPI000588DEEF|nr:helix-turn-helix transcriptional regulator [Streptococcus phage Str-PAP-1]AJD83081.1 Cro/Cl family transcriptional regulator [Streptococcus phage Str-PAP-1]
MQIVLYQLRKQNDISQEKMADVIGKTSVSYRNKELGRTDFSSSEMFKIANFFHKSISEIFIDNTTQSVN